MMNKVKKSSVEIFVPNDKADYYYEITSITVNGKNAYELKGKFLDDLHNNSFSGTNRKDAVEHIEYYLKIINPIKLPNVDKDKLRIVVVLISLDGDYKDDWIYEWNENVPWVYDKSWLDNGIWRNQHQSNTIANISIIRLDVRNGQPVIGERMVIVMVEIFLALTLLEIRSITKTLNENHDVVEREELCEIHELPMCNIRRFDMIKYSFGQDEEYVVIKEDEYDDLERTSEDACRAYQEIFRMMDEGWMVTRAE
ncbi:hypothetical protein Tco_0265159 [Tanacetum coccineum]